MELTTLMGVIVGFIAIIVAMIFKHISFTVFLNPAAFFVIFVGTTASILNSYTGKELKNLGKLFKIIFTTNKTSAFDAQKTIDTIINISTQSKKEGLLSLEATINELDDPFLGKGLRMIIDGASEEYVREVLSGEIEAMQERHATNAGIFSSAGAYAPTLGVLGAVFGLIAAMGHIDNTALMSEAIAAAFIATILGIFTGYVLWNPFAMKLKMKSKHEVTVKWIVVEGVLSIRNAESPAMIKDKLISLLSKTQQKEILAADNANLK